MNEIDRESLQGSVISLTRRGHLVIREAKQLLELLDYSGPDPFDIDPTEMRPVQRLARVRNDVYWAKSGGKPREDEPAKIISLVRPPE